MALVNKWSCNAISDEPSPDWAGYARRAAAFMQTVGEVLGGVEWRRPTESGFGRGPEVEPDDVETLREMLEQNQLRDDYGGIMEGAGTSLFLLGSVPVDGASRDLRIRPRFGETGRPVFTHVKVIEPVGLTLWSYPDEIIADLIARNLAAIAGTEARAYDEPLLALMADVGVPFRRNAASHTFLHQPPEMTNAPPRARHVPCGTGVLLVAPPGPTDEDTLERMRWVAAALEEDRRLRA